MKSGADVIAPNGKRFSESSIGMALATRNLMDHLRSTGQATSGPKAFGPRDRSNFLSALDNAVVRLQRLAMTRAHDADRRRLARNAMPVRARFARGPFVAPGRDGMQTSGLRRHRATRRASRRPISLFNDVELGLVTKPSTSDTMDHTPVFRPLPASQSQQGRD